MCSSLAFRIFNLLQGNWKIAKRIVPGGILNGQAKFERVQGNENEMIYSEIGSFQFDSGQVLEATKRYVFRFKNDDICVYFDDKSDDQNFTFFHELSINTTKHAEKHGTYEFNATHLCGPDRYDITYTFNKQEIEEYNIISQFTIKYYVSGPNKNYTSRTCFTKLKENEMQF